MGNLLSLRSSDFSTDEIRTMRRRRLWDTTTEDATAVVDAVSTTPPPSSQQAVATTLTTAAASACLDATAVVDAVSTTPTPSSQQAVATTSATLSTAAASVCLDASAVVELPAIVGKADCDLSDCSKVYLVLKGEVLILTPDMLEGIPLLRALFEYTDPDEPPVFDFPETREVEKRGLELLRKLVLFNIDRDNFCVPSHHLELLGLVRLADYLGMDEFLEEAAKWLDVSVTAISNHNSVRQVHQLIRGRYQASRHNRRRVLGVCVWCYKDIYPADQPPCRQVKELPRSPCCNQKVHPQCKAPPQCRECFQLLRVLPCMVCRRPITRGEDFAGEFVETLPHRSPCCGADCHPECKLTGNTYCPLCRCPLKDWQINRQLAMAGDIKNARHERHINNIRRYKNYPYEVVPPFHTPMWKPKCEN